VTAATPDNSYIQTLLKQWGSYVRQVAPPNLGYPSHSPYAPPSPSGAGGVDFDQAGEQQAREVDRILSGLKQQDRPAYQAIEHIYLWRTSASEAAARMRISRPGFYTVRARGESYLAGALSSIAYQAA